MGLTLRSLEEGLNYLVEWVRGNEVVGALALTSNRANPKREIDVLSDSDVELYVTDIEPFERSDAWLHNFGEIMIRWPSVPRSAAPWADITRLVLFEDAVRIDFQIRKVSEIQSDAYDDPKGEGSHPNERLASAMLRTVTARQTSLVLPERAHGRPAREPPASACHPRG
jgi:hypothetical protein